jgi:hypothetical protein
MDKAIFQNEFAMVEVRRDESANGVRLLIRNLATGNHIYLDPRPGGESRKWVRQAGMRPSVPTEARADGAFFAFLVAPAVVRGLGGDVRATAVCLLREWGLSQDDAFWQILQLTIW